MNHVIVVRVSTVAVKARVQYTVQEGFVCLLIVIILLVAVVLVCLKSHLVLHAQEEVVLLLNQEILCHMDIAREIIVTYMVILILVLMDILVCSASIVRTAITMKE